MGKPMALFCLVRRKRQSTQRYLEPSHSSGIYAVVFMSSKIANILGLAPSEDQSVEQSSSKIKSISDWFSDLVEATKDTPLFDVLGSVGEAAKEWSGTVKAAGKLIEKLTKDTSPKVVGWLACTVAYKRASEEAIREYGRPASRIPYSAQVIAERLKNRLEDPDIMAGFSLSSAASHPFLKAADEGLTTALEAAGYSPAERRNLLRNVRARFKGALQDVLSGEEKEKFASFTAWLQLDTDDRRLDALLRSHAELQRSELNDQPALGIEPFSISDVYLEPQCGVVQWNVIRDGVEGQSGRIRVDPFAESSAPRQDLMAKVLDLMRDRRFNDAIIIQGAPGSGKSTFTKRLCVQLQDEGLVPMRIPLQFLRVDANIFDAVQDVLTKFSGSVSSTFRRDLLSEKVFAEKVCFGEGDISPYVFIFDGWDEISLSAAEGFQQRVERLLDQIRETFLTQTRTRVRVVLTGRPSQAVGSSNFLRDETPVFTMRPIRPEQLREYFEALRSALEMPAFKGAGIDHWTLGNLERYNPVLKGYKKAFPKVGDLEVLGQPLLAHLAIKVMANFKSDLSQLITPPTTLYRHLVDLTCKKGGKAPTDFEGAGKSGRIQGKDLRSLVHGTALAITAHGSESIPMEELELRLETLGVGKDIFQITKKHPLTNLMISFYFKGIHDQSGCEFLHKSFREYLTAEAIVEVIKEFATSLTDELPERPKERYWQDFQDGDPRQWLSRKLGEVLSPQWLTGDVSRHLYGLLTWETQRANSKADPSASPSGAGTSTNPIAAKDWDRVRDALADLWDWWGEGVHLRPQPIEKQKMWSVDTPPYVVDLAKLAMRRCNYNRRDPPHPLRTMTIDANLGYALFQLNCFVHSVISESRGWTKAVKKLGPFELWGHIDGRPRRYQIAISCDGKTFVQFAPSGDSEQYFRNYVSRINGAGFPVLAGFVQRGYRPDFPSRTSMRGVCLAGADLRSLSFTESDMTACNLQAANLSEVQLAETKLSYSNLRATDLFSSHLYKVFMPKADLTEAVMWMADLRGTRLTEVKGLTQKQLDSTAAGSDDFGLPMGLEAPSHWERFIEPPPDEPTATEAAES